MAQKYTPLLEGISEIAKINATVVLNWRKNKLFYIVNIRRPGGC